MIAVGEGMDFTILLDVVISLTLVYLGASLFVTIVNEFHRPTIQPACEAVVRRSEKTDRRPQWD